MRAPFTRRTDFSGRKPFSWHRFKLFGLCALILLPGAVHAFSILPSLTNPIREEILQVEGELDALPVFPMSTSPWTMTYSSRQHQAPELPVVIEVKFHEPGAVDTIALMPGIITDQRNQVQSWGFPVRFMVERIFPDGSRDVVVDYLGRDYPKPGVDPQFFSVPAPVPTAGLRITVTQPAPNATWWRASHVVSFSELYAFVGPKNVALNAGVAATSSNEFGYLWSTKCLTDGFAFFNPLFHHVEDPENNIIGHGLKKLDVAMDLGEVRLVDEFHLWPVVHEIEHNYPPSSGIGFPASIRLEASERADFSKSELIYEVKKLDYRPGAGPFMHRTKPVKARYLRFSFADGLPSRIRRPAGYPLERIALSEIEILSEGKLISRGAKVRAPQLNSEDKKRIPSLTDGRSNEGQILPLRQWLDQFKRRVQLEERLRSLRDELDAAQRQEERRFRTILLVAIGLILVLLQMVLLVRFAARRRAARMRERIACDLHDEIGANVSSMAHTTELLSESIHQPSETQTRLLGSLLESARLTYRETKHFIRFIEGENHDHDIAEQLTQVADQILGTIPRTFSLENTRSFNALNPSTKWNLLLFYKEVLNNIIKHAHASEVKITTSRQDRELMLEVVDNGRGFSQESPYCRRLEERAALLHGKLKIDSRPDEGTRITVYFRCSQKP